MAKNKISAKQKAAKIQAAEEREQRAIESRERQERRKRIFTIIVCVILVLALGLPTMGLALFAQG